MNSIILYNSLNINRILKKISILSLVITASNCLAWSHEIELNLADFEEDEYLYGVINVEGNDNIGKEFEAFVGDVICRFKVNEETSSVTLIAGKSSGTEEVVEFPDYVFDEDEYYALKKIAPYAFKDAEGSTLQGVKKIILPEGLLYIGQNCFEDAPDLNEIVLPSTLYGIPSGMCLNCPKLKKVKITSDSRLREIGDYAFEGCVSLQSFCIPVNVKSIGQAPWCGCKALKSLEIDKGNYNFLLEDGVLYCKSDTKILVQYPAGKRQKTYYVETGTKVIGNSAFYGNEYIEEVYFPVTIRDIENTAFSECRNLSVMKFIGPLNFIGSKAFFDCPKLKTVEIYGTPDIITDKGAFNSFMPNVNVVVTKEAPKFKLVDTDKGTLQSAWKSIAKIPGIYKLGKIRNSRIEMMQKYLGKGKIVGYGNSDPKQDILYILDAVPSSMIAYEIGEVNGRLERLYVEESNGIYYSLFIFVGTNGNDSIAILFKTKNKASIDEFIRLKLED